MFLFYSYYFWHFQFWGLFTVHVTIYYKATLITKYGNGILGFCFFYKTQKEHCKALKVQLQVYIRTPNKRKTVNANQLLIEKYNHKTHSFISSLTALSWSGCLWICRLSWINWPLSVDSAYHRHTYSHLGPILHSLMTCFWLFRRLETGKPVETHKDIGSSGSNHGPWRYEFISTSPPRPASLFCQLFCMLMQVNDHYW